MKRKRDERDENNKYWNDLLEGKFANENGVILRKYSLTGTVSGVTLTSRHSCILLKASSPTFQLVHRRICGKSFSPQHFRFGKLRHAGRSFFANVAAAGHGKQCDLFPGEIISFREPSMMEGSRYLHTGQTGFELASPSWQKERISITATSMAAMEEKARKTKSDCWIQFCRGSRSSCPAPYHRTGRSF